MFDECPVQDSDAAACDCSHCELFLAGDSELSHQKDIQIGVQDLRDLECDWHTAARKREHDYIGVYDDPLEPIGQNLTCLHAVTEHGIHQHRSALLGVV